VQAAQADPSNLYVKHRGAWQRLLDLGVQRAIPVIGLGTVSPTDIVVLNITLTSRANYLYIVVWTNHEGRQIIVSYRSRETEAGYDNWPSLALLERKGSFRVSDNRGGTAV